MLSPLVAAVGLIAVVVIIGFTAVLCVALAKAGESGVGTDQTSEDSPEEELQILCEELRQLAIH